MLSWRTALKLTPVVFVLALVGALLAFNSSDATRDTEGTPATVKKNEVPSVDSGQLDVKPRKSMPDGEPSQKGKKSSQSGPAELKSGYVVSKLPETDLKQFSMLGVTWDSGLSEDASEALVEVRWRSDGKWSDWTDLHMDPQPVQDGRAGTEPRWVGKSDAAQVRVLSENKTKPKGLQLVTIDPGKSPELEPAAAGVTQPKIIKRSSWGAKPKRNCSSPIRAKLKGAVVHHTAGSNSYTKAQSRGIVKSAQAYHMNGRGWCDIGYNFLIDKYGQVFEGRAGGVKKSGAIVKKNVRGAHAGNYQVNSNAMGVSLMGTFTSANPTKAMKNSLAKLIAWRFHQNNLPAKGKVKMGSKNLSRISGHRNVVSTACPGAKVYNWLTAKNGLRAQVKKLLNDKGTVDGLKRQGWPSSNKVSIKWSAYPKAKKYRVYAGTKKNVPRPCKPHCTVIKPKDLKKPSYSFTKLPNGDKVKPGQTYYMKVSAINGNGKTISGWQKSAVQAGTPVKNISLSNVKSTSAKVSWDQVPAAKKYRIFYSTSKKIPSKCGSNCQVIKPKNLKKPSHQLSGLKKGKTYYVWITSLNANGKTFTGWQDSPTKLKLTPAEVTGISATPKSSTSMTVSWDKYPDAKKYRIYAWTKKKVPRPCKPHCTVIAPKDADNPSHTLDDLLPGETYYVKVSPINSNGQVLTGWPADPVKVKLKPAQDVVEDISVSNVKSSAAEVSWGKVPGAKKYRIYAWTKKKVPRPCKPHCTVIKPDDADNPSHKLTGLTEGDTYYVKVSAINAEGKTFTSWQDSPTTLKLKPGTDSGDDSAATTKTNKVTLSGSTKQVKFKGHGYGHGIGMSQYGAEGAARQGKTYKQILNKYYPGTKIGNKAGKIRVWLTGNKGTRLTVKAEDGLKFKHGNQTVTLPAKVGGKQVNRWRIGQRADKKNLSLLRYRTGSTWKNYSKVKPWEGEAEFRRPTLTLYSSNGSTDVYRGALRSAHPKPTTRSTVNVLSLENYTKGVVAREVPASWHAAALKAQTVAARTYAVQEMRPGRYYDICDTTACQVYGGASAETSATNSAVTKTKGDILTYNGEPAFTQFSSSSGGFTAKGSKPYLKAVKDPWDNWSGNANHNWTKSVKRSTIQSKYPGIGKLKSMTISKRNGHGAQGGRVLKMKLTGGKGSRTIDGNEARSAFGLKSNWFGF